MAKIIELGRVCIKLTGRDAGRQVIISQIVNDKMVMIRSPLRKKGQKQRKCAIKHLEPTAHKVNPNNEKEISKILGAV